MSHHNPLSSISEEKLQHLQHYGPVTAIKLHENFIIVGYGPILKIFNRDEHDELVFSKQVFKRNKIHDIAVKGQKIAVSGARSFALLDFLSESPITERAINEWITAIEFLSEDTLLILTSHNEILEIAASISNDMKLIKKYHCNEKSILYSGSIRVLDESTVYIAAGTVMHGVLIWSLFDCRIVHNLTDHEGSIFEVKIDPSGNYIISCSDDRSVKLYDFSGQLLATGWGHGSRIWSLEFVSVTDEAVRVFSTGEDCTVRIWEYQNAPTLKQINLYDHYHSGKHIWSGDVNNDVFVTGGADGKVRAEKLEENEEIILDLDRADLSVNTNIKRREAIKAFGVLHECGFTLALTTTGNILLHDHHTKAWQPLQITDSSLEETRSFTMIKTFEEFRSFVLCSSEGRIIVIGFDIGRTMYQVLLDSKFAGIEKIINTLSSVSKEAGFAHLLLNSPIAGQPMVLVRFSFDGGRLRFSDSFELHKADSRIFIPTSFYVDSTNEWVYVGSRHANLAMYDIKLKEPKFMTKLCSGDTITSVSLVQISSKRSVILVTLRDGIYIFVDICETASRIASSIILKNKITKAIEGGFMKDNHLLLYGFSSSHFCFWDETKQAELSKVLCGGGHRHWEISIQHEVPRLVFSYIYRGTLHLSTLQSSWDSKNGLLIEGTHGREIRDVAIQPIAESDGTKLVASASEDSTIKIGKLDEKGQLEYFWTLNNHISGLQRVAFLNPEYLASSAANEELIIWKVTRLSEGNLALCESARIETAETYPDLRIMDFSSIETSEGFHIACAYSNSNIKLFFYNKQSLRLEEGVTIPYGLVCVLNIGIVSFGPRHFILTGTSDGNLTFWEVSDLLNGGKQEENTPIIKQQLHQSAVKAIFPIPLYDGTYRIITGGDDNSLISSTLKLENDELSLTTTAFVEKAASATITSISGGSDGRILVTSVDQIVRLWDTREGSLECLSATYTTVADTGCSDTTKFGKANLSLVAGAGISTFRW